jgi:hypothetical protein
VGFVGDGLGCDGPGCDGPGCDGLGCDGERNARSHARQPFRRRPCTPSPAGGPARKTARARVVCRDGSACCQVSLWHLRRSLSSRCRGQSIGKPSRRLCRNGHRDVHPVRRSPGAAVGLVKVKSRLWFYIYYDAAGRSLARTGKACRICIARKGSVRLACRSRLQAGSTVLFNEQGCPGVVEAPSRVCGSTSRTSDKGMVNRKTDGEFCNQTGIS